MKKLYLLIALSAMLMAASCQENSTEALNDSPEEYLPLSTGNYWIYRSSVLDAAGSPTGEVYIDSMVITGTKSIKGQTAFEAVTYRNNAVLEKGYYGIRDKAISIYALFFEPLLKVDSADCGCGLSERWADIVRFDQSNWFAQDSTKGDDYQSLVIDTTDSTYKIVNSTTAWFLTRNAQAGPEDNFSIDGRTASSKMFSLKGNTIYKLIEPDFIQLQPDPSENYEYLDNNRGIVLNYYELTLWYSKGIGLVQSTGKMTYNKTIKYHLNRQLIRYHVN